MSDCWTVVVARPGYSSCLLLLYLSHCSRMMPSHVLNTLVTALVHSWLDYCNVVFAGLPACNIQRLVSPQHSRTSGRRLIATRSRDFSAT